MTPSTRRTILLGALAVLVPLPPFARLAHDPQFLISHWYKGKQTPVYVRRSEIEFVGDVYGIWFDVHMRDGRFLQSELDHKEAVHAQPHSTVDVAELLRDMRAAGVRVIGVDQYRT